MGARSAAPPPDLGALFEEHFAYVWNALRRLGVREADLEDLVHDVFLKVHRSLAEYDPARAFRPWVFGFAYRVAADHRRLARHRVEVLGLHTDPTDPAGAPDRQVEAAQQRTLVHEALDSVELDRRAVLVLHDIDGEPAPSIADALSIPLNTVYSRLRVARKEFGAAVKRLRARGAR